MLTLERLREVLSYEPSTGELRWKVSRANQIEAGDLAGKYESNGRLRVKVDGKLYLGHRLAWFHHYGQWPQKFIDHINGDPKDNRVSNLRLATNQENAGNQKRARHNTSGFKGVNRKKCNGRYQAYIRVQGKREHLGYFETAEEAHEAYVNAAKERFGEFARAN